MKKVAIAIVAVFLAGAASAQVQTSITFAFGENTAAGLTTWDITVTDADCVGTLGVDCKAGIKDAFEAWALSQVNGSNVCDDAHIALDMCTEGQRGNTLDQNTMVKWAFEQLILNLINWDQRNAWQEPNPATEPIIGRQ
jgi:hypothetical protein